MDTVHMKLEQIKWPVYVLHSDEIEEQDGLLYCDTQIVDDKNMKGETLGIRRLQSPHKNLYHLKVMIESLQDFVHHKGLNYIDSDGKYFRWIKNKVSNLISHKIEKIERRAIGSLVWCEIIPFPFFIKRPPEARLRYASVLYMDNQPSILYSFSEKQQKKTWRKI